MWNTEKKEVLDMIKEHAYMYEILRDQSTLLKRKSHTSICDLWLVFEMPHSDSQAARFSWTPFLCLTPCFNLLWNVFNRASNSCFINLLVLKFFAASKPGIMVWPELVPKSWGNSRELRVTALSPLPIHQMLTSRHYWWGYWAYLLKKLRSI